MNILLLNKIVEAYHIKHLFVICYLFQGMDISGF